MFLKIVANQARYKWPVTLLLWAAIGALVTLYVYLGNSQGFTNRSMQLIMKNMGHNLLILPKAADPLATYLCTDEQVDFPEGTTRKMARHRKLATKYFTSILQQRVSVHGESVILTGIEPVLRGDETAEKRHLTEPVPPGKATLGAEAARRLGVEPGGRVEFAGESFEVLRVDEPLGTTDDHRVCVPLADAQRVLGKPGKINAILSFLCLHGTSLKGISARTTRQFAKLFPDYRIVTQTPIARGRYLARMTTNRYLSYLLALVLCITVAVVAITGVQEISERRREVGILLAMGAIYPYIVALYVAKLLAVAVAASVAGFFIGSLLSRGLLSPVLVSNTRPVAFIWGQLPNVIGLTCLVTLLAAIVPAVKLVRMDPTAILVEE